MTTFFGLLYTAEVRLGIDEADGFRFHVDRESIRRLEGIYGELGDGRFPETEVDWGRTPLTFILGFRRTALGRVVPRRPQVDEEFDSSRVEIGGITTEEVAELGDRDAVLDETTRRLLRSPVVLPLIDASTLPDDAGDDLGRLAQDDRRLSRAFGLLLKFLSAERKRGGRRLFPLFVLTKFDRCSPAALRRLEAPPGPPLGWGPDARSAFGDRLLGAHFPETRQILSESRSRKVEIARPSWFYSEVSTEPHAAIRIRRRWRPPSGGWEPEYPFEEYRALLDRLGDLAHRVPQSALA
jgi:hypothetical protein